MEFLWKAIGRQMDWKRPIFLIYVSRTQDKAQVLVFMS